MNELEYLRKELNQRLGLFYENSYKIQRMILIVWGGTFALLGNNMGDALLFFFMITIFFISIAILYLVYNNESENVNQIFRIGAYIAMFYERKPCVEISGNAFWELAIFRMMNDEIKSKNRKSYEVNNEYFGFSSLAFIIMFILIAIFGLKNKSTILQGNEIIFMAFMCIVYIIVSLFWFLPEIRKNSNISPENRFNAIKNNMKIFKQYATELGYYTEAEAKERFGVEIYDIIKNEDETDKIPNKVYRTLGISWGQIVKKCLNFILYE